MKITITHTNHNPDTIYNKLKTKLGREPTLQELKNDVQRIIRGDRYPC